jgi:hypothetical protein
MLKRTMTAAALAVALATPAFAQTQAPVQATPPVGTNSSVSGGASSHTFVQRQQAGEWRGSKLMGASVYGPDNNSIGEINDVLIGDNGNVRAVVIGVGGFLGVGEKDVALPFEALNLKRKADSTAIDKITVSYSKEQLKNAPKFAYYGSNQKQTTGEGSSSSSPMTNTAK